MQQLKDRIILVGVTGGIAAYKTCSLVRLLKKEGAIVKVIMTESASKLIHPNTFKALSGGSVDIDIFGEAQDIDHISLTRNIDLFVIAPLTANTMAKLAYGMADNLLTTTVLAATGKILIAPAMNCNMYLNPITQENLQRLRSLGFYVAEPGDGSLACGEEGPGRMAEPEEIFNYVVNILNHNELTGIGYDDNLIELKEEEKLTYNTNFLLSNSKCVGKKILITAGPTREYIDPVRYISNESSGKMGYALAAQAALKGAEVTLVSGPVYENKPRGVHIINVVTANEMFECTMEELYKNEYDIVISTAAICDFRPLHYAESKIKKTCCNDNLDISLVKNKDLIATIASLDNRPYCVGFAAETDSVIEYGQKKLENKNLDLIVVNDVSRHDIGFNSDENEVTILNRNGENLVLEKGPKSIIASRILDYIITCYDDKNDE